MITGIVDAYAGDGAWELDVAARAGVVAIFHKATEGLTYRDSVFDHAMRCAALVGMLRGAYHYGNGRSGGAEQAKRFLAAVTPHGPDVLLCLDLEGRLDDRDHDGIPDDRGTMSTADARAFLEHVRAVTGRWPLLYGGRSKTAERMRTADAETRAVFARCPLWLAQYGEEPEAPEPWGSWDLWQYSDGKPKDGPHNQVLYPRSTPGMHRADRSAWRGTLDELRVWWATVGR